MARALAAAALIVCALTAARAQNFARPSQEYGNAQRYPIAWVPQLAADLPLAQADFDRRHAEGGISDSFSQVTGNLGAVVSAVDPGLVERLQAAGIATQAQLQAHIGQRQRQGAPREELEPLYRLDYAQEVLSSVLDGQRELLRPQSAA
ncbi:MAG: hypothetical protein KGK30_06915, partial [Elusimicrobia bacterium]|nr:hypothetical protein [Elusimicrobiota bacterium]